MLIIFIITILISSVQGQTCPYKECSCVDAVIDCSNRQLTAIPVLLNTGASFTTLLLNGNQIVNISNANSLPTNLDTLDLRDNPIAYMAADAFIIISQSLKVIRFRRARFTTLPAVLELFDNLQILDVEAFASLTFPDPTVSKLAESLLELSLVNVTLGGWPSFLNKFVFLRKLYLDNNSKITTLPANSFEIWKSELTHLSLANTGISSSSPIAVCEKLQWLNLARNKLTDAVALSFDLIPMANTLKYIDASGNGLTSEPRLSDLRVLTDVYLASNKINTSTAGAFPPSVLTINLDNNLFSSIPAFIKSLPNVQNFSIQANNITLIGAHDFPVNSRLVSVELGGNPISSIDEHGFDDVRTYLTYLDLAATKLTRLPLALKVLSKLETLWMPNNSNLICTCDEKSLSAWISALPTMRIVGECGNVDIKEFIGQLALLCP